MCDYSLMEYRSRLAVDGEELEVFSFPSGAKGFVAMRRTALRLVGAPLTPCVVCVPPGARLLLQNIPSEIQARLGVTDTEEVTFTQLHARAFCFRDAVRFEQGQTLLLQELQVGQRAEVINVSMPEEASVIPELVRSAA